MAKLFINRIPKQHIAQVCIEQKYLEKYGGLVAESKHNLFEIIQTISIIHVNMESNFNPLLRHPFVYEQIHQSQSSCIINTNIIVHHNDNFVIKPT